MPVRLGHPGPRRALEHAHPVVRRGVAAGPSAVAEVEETALRAAGGRGERLLEEAVLGGAVIRHEVDDHPHPELVRPVGESVEVVEGAVHRVDGAVVGDVVPPVALGGGVEGREPDGIRSEARDVVEVPGDAGEVAGAVAVGVGERPRVDLVDDGGAPPLGVGSIDHRIGPLCA